MSSRVLRLREVLCVSWSEQICSLKDNLFHCHYTVRFTPQWLENATKHSDSLPLCGREQEQTKYKTVLSFTNIQQRSDDLCKPKDRCLQTAIEADSRASVKYERLAVMMKGLLPKYVS